jgi:hypothetical protein
MLRPLLPDTAPARRLLAATLPRGFAALGRWADRPRPPRHALALVLAAAVVLIVVVAVAAPQ